MAVLQSEPLPGSLNANRRLSQWLTIESAGRVTIHPGKVEIGQGILTALAQIAADELDVALSRVAVRPASTDLSPNEGVTSGSRSITDSGLALRHACAAARQIFLSVTAQRTGVPLDRSESTMDASSVLLEKSALIGTYRAANCSNANPRRAFKPNRSQNARFPVKLQRGLIFPTKFLVRHASFTTSVYPE